jgi:hypothetical protein
VCVRACVLAQIEKLLPEITGKPEGEDPEGIRLCMPDLPEALAKEFGHDGLGEFAPDIYKGPIEVLSRGGANGKCICARACTRTHPQRDKHRHVRTCAHAHVRKQRIHATTWTFVRFLQQHGRRKFTDVHGFILLHIHHLLCPFESEYVLAAAWTRGSARRSILFVRVEGDGAWSERSEKLQMVT